MLKSFFPNPRWFFPSAVLWIALAVGLWYLGGKHFGAHFGLPPAGPKDPPPIGIQMFWTKPFLWFYLYYAAFFGSFAAFWRVVAPHPWFRWSVLGSGLIIFVTFLDVQVNVAINNWYGPFYDLLQNAFAKTAPVTEAQIFHGLSFFLIIALGAVILGTLNIFFVAHYVFRWRTAMNDYYVQNWDRLRKIEGAAQRVQEDTMRFGNITEDLGVSLVKSVMTLLAFLPVLDKLSRTVTALPVVGHVPHPLVLGALLWSIFGTIFLASIGLKLPGLNFRNQRVEAAYRKELVYGEDHNDRAEPATLKVLFSNVRKNYYRMYFHYMYFNLGRIIYLQTDNIFSIVLLAPTIAAGGLTFGLFTQITTAFTNVSASFQYLVSSWTTIIELISIYKRLHAFEATLDEKPLDGIEAQPAV